MALARASARPPLRVATVRRAAGQGSRKMKPTPMLNDREWMVAKLLFDEKPGDECWLWRGTYIHNRGRPRGTFWSRDHRHTFTAARAVYERMVGSAGELFVCHRCNNPMCVNPSHLYLATNKQNILDAARDGLLPWKLKTECKRGHPLYGENLYITSQGRRACRICNRASKRKHDEKRRRARKEQALAPRKETT